MVEQFFSLLNVLDDQLWNFIGFPLVFFLGLLVTIKARCVQVRRFPFAVRNFVRFLKTSTADAEGVHPIKAFFACVGGCIGIGNVVAICTAVQIGGPGALFWVWVTALFGMILKYSELYLGMRFRVHNPAGGYSGGPMYFLKHAFKWSWIPIAVSLLLCVYGVEIYQFRVATSSISINFGLNHLVVTFLLLGLVIYAGRGGVARVGAISSLMIPVFFVIYFVMGLWVLYQHAGAIPGVLYDVFVYAFTPHAAVGGTIGGLLVTVTQGIRRGCYTTDVGVGYASVIHSESSNTDNRRQAALAIMDIFLDTFLICTMSILLILVTGVWDKPIEASLLVQTALGMHFPHMDIFMPTFLTLLGFSTITAYFCVGLKCAEFLGPKWGRKIFYVYAVVALFLFSFVDTSEALVVMSITQVMLILFNLTGIYLLRDKVNFNLSD